MMCVPVAYPIPRGAAISPISYSEYRSLLTLELGIPDNDDPDMDGSFDESDENTSNAV